MKYQILTGNNCDVLRQFPDNHFDSIVTDPPYGIDFLGKSWDANTGALETYQECLRVLKPGGHILAFSAARTYHHLAITLESAGFEIRDQIMWIYSSGFPKSQDIGKSIDRAAGKKDPNYGTNKASVVTTAEGRNESTYVRCKICNKGLNGNTANDCDKNPCGLKYAYQTEDGRQWAGWGTQLKPAHEPIALARKPIKLSIARNCQTHGVGALNIDAARVGEDPMIVRHLKKDDGKAFTHHGDGKKNWDSYEDVGTVEGRFPSNVLGEIPDYQKYFYCPKVSRAERHIGFDNDTKTHWQMAEEMGGSLVDHEGNPTRSGNKALIPGVGDIYTHSLSKKYEDWCKQNNKPMPNSGNNHPTVKPIELMKYLIKLVTPSGGTVLDPFNGSGSTGCAAVELGYDYTGIELDLKYVDIARKRIAAWYEHTHPTDPLVASGLFEQ